MPSTILERKKSRTRKDGAYVTEGALTIKNALLLIDDCYLSEFIQRHFGVRNETDGTANLGKVQIIISRVNE